MKLSVKSDYAARAVLGLARRRDSAGPVPVDALAEEYNIPPNYLVQILLKLKSHHLVRSHRGKEGGYELARKPSEITLGDVIRCVHGQCFESPAMNNPDCPPELRAAWKGIQDAIDKALNAVNFEDLAEASGDKAKMYYI